MIRLLTAGILIPVFYLYVTRLPAIYFTGLVMLLSLFALFEYFSMTSIRRAFWIPAAISGAVMGWVASSPSVYNTFDILLMLCLALFLFRLFLNRHPEGAVRDMGILVTALVYIPGLFSYQALLRRQGAEYIILLYAVVWSCDGLALYAGRFLGRHKLYPSMSPSKTVEGAVGGLVGGILAALVVNSLYSISSHAVIALLGALLSVVGQCGDLVESMLKRDAGVKDSSNVFPGHGGVLDKIDAALFAGPVLYFWLRLF